MLSAIICTKINCETFDKLGNIMFINADESHSIMNMKVCSLSVNYGSV